MFSDANGTNTNNITLKIPDAFTKQQLWETILEMQSEIIMLKKKLKRKKSNESR